MKEKIKETVDKLVIWLKAHPSALLGLSLAAIGIYLQWCVIGLVLSPIELISDEAILQVLSTSTEVVAGLYGLTLTGYIFFLDRLQQKAEDDELLEDIIALLKKRYHNMVLLLSANCLAVIVLAFSLILYNTESNLFAIEVYRFVAYETILLVFTAVILIIYFVLTVIDPDKIPRISLKYKQKMNSSDKELGSLLDFLQDYEDIEQILQEKSADLAIANIGTNPWKALKHLKGKEMMEMRKWLSDPLMKKVTKIGQYYSYMVFSQEMTVTKEMCDLAKEVKEELKTL